MTDRRTSILLFLFGAGANIYVHLLGYLAFSEVALVVAVPFTLFASDYSWIGRRMKVCLVLLGLWLVSAVVSDLANGTEMQTALRGWARPIFLGGGMLVSCRLFRQNPASAVWFFLGLAVSNTIGMFVFKPGAIDVTEQFYDITIAGDFRKQGVAIVMSAALAFLFWRGARWSTLAGVLCMGLGLLAVALGSRSAGGEMLLLGVLLIAAYRFLPINSGGFRMSWGWIAVSSFLFLAGAYCLLGAYKHAASQGWLGEEASKKYREQSQNRYGVLLGGRMDFLSGALAVIDSPLLGHGSWPLDTEGYMLHAAELAGTELDPEYRRNLEAGLVRIPSHSQMLEPWVEHGFVATWFWFYIIWVMGLCFVRGVFAMPELFPAATFLLITRTWDLLFSPFGGRIAVGAAFALFVILADRAEAGQRCGADEAEQSSRLPSPRPRFMRNLN